MHRNISQVKLIASCFIFFLAISAAVVVWAQSTRTHLRIEAEDTTKGGGEVNIINDNLASAGRALEYGSNASWDPKQTLAPGTSLPSDATCSARVVDTPEIRPQLASRNSVAGSNKGLPGSYKSRVTGAFTGSTDEILQWTACKWGIDVDMVRAQAVKESFWTFALGDWTTTVSACPPGHGLGVDGRPGECPESYGILQVRYLYHGPPAGLNTWPEIETSTAYNADYTYSVWRECYDGGYGWLNDVERGAQYAAGDAWGCFGVWFSGRWKTQTANTYITDVQNIYSQKTWTTTPFINHR